MATWHESYICPLRASRQSGCGGFSHYTFECCESFPPYNFWPNCFPPQFFGFQWETLDVSHKECSPRVVYSLPLAVWQIERDLWSLPRCSVEKERGPLSDRHFVQCIHILDLQLMFFVFNMLLIIVSAFTNMVRRIDDVRVSHEGVYRHRIYVYIICIWYE